MTIRPVGAELLHADRRPYGQTILRQAEVAQGIPSRLRPRTFLTARAVGRQPNAPAAFTPGEIPG